MNKVVRFHVLMIAMNTTIYSTKDLQISNSLTCYLHITATRSEWRGK